MCNCEMWKMKIASVNPHGITYKSANEIHHLWSLIHDVSAMLNTVTQQIMEKQDIDSGLDVDVDKNGYSRTKVSPCGQRCAAGSKHMYLHIEAWLVAVRAQDDIVIDFRE